MPPAKSSPGLNFWHGPSSPEIQPRAAFLALALLGLLLAASLNNTVPYHGDESFYMAAAVRMVRTGDYLLPMFFDAPRFQKPILPYWATVAGYKVFGIHLWSGRLVFFLMAGGLLLLVWRLANRLDPDGRPGQLAALLLASSTVFIESARVSMTDLPLTFFSFAALYFFHAATASPAKARWSMTMAWVAMGLATASKGPLGLAPLVAFVAALAMARPSGWKRLAAQTVMPWSIALWVVIGLSWHTWAWLSHRDVLLAQLTKEATANTAGGWLALAGHALFYPAALAAVFPFGVAAALVSRGRRVAPDGRYAVLGVYALVMCVVPIGLHGERLRYLLPAIPVLAVLSASVLVRTSWRKVCEWAALVAAVAQALVILGIPAVRGEPLRDLVAVWRGDGAARGTLAQFGLPSREHAWLLALSGGDLADADGRQPYVIVREDDEPQLPPHAVVARARQLRQISMSGRTPMATYRWTLLVRLERP